MSLTDQKLIDEKLTHLLTFSKMCAPEYNTHESSDRVLVFDVMRDNWDATCILNLAVETKAVRESETTSEKGGKRKVETAEESLQKRLKQAESEEQPLAHSPVENSQELSCEQAVDDVEGQGEQVAITNAETQIRPNDSPESQNLNEPLRQHKINVNSLWLSLQSGYFRSLLHSSGMKENHDEEVHLKIPKSEENAHLTLLEAMYQGDILLSKTVPELLAVLELTDKYDLMFLSNICKCVLQKKVTSFAEATQIMHVIKEKHCINDVEKLAATVQLVLAKEFSPLDENWQYEKFTSLSEPSLKYLLSSNDLVVQSENTVFHALMHWIEQNEIDPASLDKTSDLLNVVRFELVTIDYLYNVIRKHPTASRMPSFNALFLRGMTYHALPSKQKTLLKEKPTLRKEPDRTIIQNICIIKEQDYDTLLHDRDKKVLNSPDEFWACGYKMSVGITRRYHPSVNDAYERSQLSVINLTEESLVPLHFSIGINEQSTEMQRKTFTSDSSAEKYTYNHLSHVHFSAEGTFKLYVAIKPL